MMRAMLYEAAHVVLVRSTKWSWLKAGRCTSPGAADEESHRRPGSTTGRDHAPHLDRGHRVPVDQGGRSSMITVRDLAQ